VELSAQREARFWEGVARASRFFMGCADVRAREAIVAPERFGAPDTDVVADRSRPARQEWVSTGGSPAEAREAAHRCAYTAIGPAASIINLG
jgi:hypothetical protein